MACFNIYDVFDIILHRVCSMQHESPTSLTYPGSCKSCFSRKTVFGGKVLLIFPIIYQIVDQNLALWSCWQLPWIPESSSFNWFGGKNEQFSQFAHIFHRDQTCFGISDIEIKLFTVSVMPKPVYLMTLCRRHTRSTTPWWIKSCLQSPL